MGRATAKSRTSGVRTREVKKAELISSFWKLDCTRGDFKLAGRPSADQAGTNASCEAGPDGRTCCSEYGLVCSTSPFLVFTKLEAEFSKTQAGRENRPNCHLHMQLQRASRRQLARAGSSRSPQDRARAKESIRLGELSLAPGSTHLNSTCSLVHSFLLICFLVSSETHSSK